MNQPLTSRGGILICTTLLALGAMVCGGAQCMTQFNGMVLGATDDNDADTNDTGDASTSGLKSVSFANQIQPIFDSYCIRCHKIGGFAERSGVPLKLIASESYARLVNVASAQDSTWILVQPGYPASSLLFRKITDETPPVGIRMPWDRGAAPTMDEIELIRTWIAEGAENN